MTTEEARRDQSADATKGLTILIAGGSSAAGIAGARAFTQAGHRVISVGSDGGRIAAAVAGIPGATGLVCDLADPDSVSLLADQVHDQFGLVDGLVHLVGGWRGGDGIAGQSDVDWDFLQRNVLTTLRNTSRTFYPDLAASVTGRLSIVSSTAVSRPTAGNANYAAVKAAAEAWVLAVADGFAVDGSRAAAVILAVKALVYDGMRAAAPQRNFPGFTDVKRLAEEVAGLFARPAAELNGSRIIL
ncbi:SDR family NAD(P)-dependent oxidoreductase [Paenarthrobacter sp. Z7-10]|uniref:SDR family NAD(P)-dependent oxidoreductase n=1 Tax=Paenarthrobacter sp. Z7-10 TaxID=2787635 RepID=UPI0022A9E277|nr:SDR family NAD(P)-dependent oxidoreductase [Paenarthrobacter sp. Z7-10]MCZ2403818.1 SDR family NAD(P)-dependent oxidoreductase [Paenarthrobacter sp. Z7-10]